MFISEAKVKDLDSLSWFVYEGDKVVRIGTTGEHNQKHALVIRPKDTVGLKKATRGSGAGNYQVVLGSAVHVLFRNVPAAKIDKLEFTKFRGKNPEHAVLPEGRKRTSRVRIQEKQPRDKQSDDYYKPDAAVRETSTYDKENYQWRKVVHAGTAIKSLKQGRSKYTLQEGDVIGVRYMTKARGGFVILPNDLRVNISHDTYEAIVGTTRILPSSRQQRGLVVIADVAKTMPKQTRIRKAKAERPEDTPVEKSNEKTARRALADIKHKPILHVPKDTPKNPTPDFDDDEDTDEEEPPVIESHTPAKVLKVGMVVQSSKVPDNEFVVVNAETNNGFTEFSLYSPKQKTVRKFRLRENLDMSSYKSIALKGTATASELAAGKRAYTKAVKDKKFAVGSIHDK